MGARDPCFDAYRPASGAVTMIIRVIGRNRSPAWNARVAAQVRLHVQAQEEERGEHPERDRERHEVACRERRDPEERQRHHRVRAAELPARGTPTTSTTPADERGEDQRVAPALLVRLDQPVGEREQARRCPAPGRGCRAAGLPRSATRGPCAVATTKATMPIGTLRKNTDSQPRCSTMQPPRVGPSASARPDTPAHSPIAFARSCGGT